MGAQDILHDIIKWQTEQKITDEALRHEAASHTSGEAAKSKEIKGHPDVPPISRCSLVSWVTVYDQDLDHSPECTARFNVLL